jgi:hypothetical protein
VAVMMVVVMVAKAATLDLIGNCGFIGGCEHHLLRAHFN